MVVLEDQQSLTLKIKNTGRVNHKTTRQQWLYFVVRFFGDVFLLSIPFVNAQTKAVAVPLGRGDVAGDYATSIKDTHNKITKL